MRYQYLSLFFLLLSANVFAQANEPDITGLWKGTLYNDTTRQFYKYEIGISEENGSLSGFSYVEVDSMYFSVKKLNIRRAGEKIFMEDAGMISNNYPQKPEKGVKQLSTLTLTIRDNVMTLTGDFTTSITKKYHALTGSITVERKNAAYRSELVNHLVRLNKKEELSFLNDAAWLAQNNTIITTSQPGAIARNTITENRGKRNEVKDIPTPAVAIEMSVVKEDVVVKNDLAKNAAVKKETSLKEEIKEGDSKNLSPALTSNTISSATVAVSKNDLAKNDPVNPNISLTTDPKKEDAKNTSGDVVKLNTNPGDTVYSIASKNVPYNPNQPVDIAEALRNKVGQATIDNHQDNQSIIKPRTKTIKEIISQPALAAISAPAAEVDKRTTFLQQTVSFRSDSLQIALYDNGEVDGDTVSVLMNGNIIMAKERLSTNAIRKTIYIPKETDSVQLVMYAENLGLIPPNTGLLVVKDGKDLYEIRFSGDFQKNAAILFRRKKQ